jgi:ZIP family zinc transporter
MWQAGLKMVFICSERLKPACAASAADRPWKDRDLPVAVFVALGAALMTAAGGLTALRVGTRRYLVLALAAGLMLGLVVFDLLPEGLDHAPGAVGGVPTALVAFAVGFLAIHSLSRLLGQQHGDHTGHHHAVHAPGLGLGAAGGLVLHSVMDGFAIGAGFQISSATGAIVAIAVVTHDFADGFNTVSITSLYGNNRRRSLTMLLCDVLAPVAGAALTVLIAVPSRALGLYLAAFGGGLLYLAATDILPQAQCPDETPSRARSMLPLAVTMLGVGLMGLVVSLAN